MRFQGWVLVPVVSAAALFMLACILVFEGVEEAGIRTCVRASARASGLLFLLPFLASSLRRLWKHGITAWLLANRRYLGVSFAAVQFIHLGTLVALTALSGSVFEFTGSLAAGGLAYGFVAAMALTSTDRTAAWLKPARWRLLHTTGLYYLWIAFATTWARDAARDPIAAAYTALFVLALLVRLGVGGPLSRSRRRSRSGS
ncbi:MAG: hypothetical protein JSU66_13790 [Deltaproteobacteria bacterium]|nr:MAG: hypothetical protein JSU66_13790 [Deltaproteobacteria bacterium]